MVIVLSNTMAAVGAGLLLMLRQCCVRTGLRKEAVPMETVVTLPMERSR